MYRITELALQTDRQTQACWPTACSLENFDEVYEMRSKRRQFALLSQALRLWLRYFQVNSGTLSYVARGNSRPAVLGASIAPCSFHAVCSLDNNVWFRQRRVSLRTERSLNLRLRRIKIVHRHCWEKIMCTFTKRFVWHCCWYWGR